MITNEVKAETNTEDIDPFIESLFVNADACNPLDILKKDNPDDHQSSKE